MTGAYYWPDKTPPVLRRSYRRSRTPPSAGSRASRSVTPDKISERRGTGVNGDKRKWLRRRGSRQKGRHTWPEVCGRTIPEPSDSSPFFPFPVYPSARCVKSLHSLSSRANVDHNSNNSMHSSAERQMVEAVHRGLSSNPHPPLLSSWSLWRGGGD